ncbi:MAG: CotH kinase family protein [Bacteroidaceae bacterium]|nr:CotH kinase family protein [Bacteroidaceae bacterium]
MRKIQMFLLLIGTATLALGQPMLSKKHGLFDSPFRLTMRPSVAGRVVRFTLDGSQPTLTSQRYMSALTIDETTVVRAAEVIGDTALSATATATYIFPESILTQANDAEGNPTTPSGYPDKWGSFIQISGTAPGYYAMDSHIVSENKTEILAGIHDLPVVAINTAPDNLFSHTADSVTGGIYIYTGAPVGSGIGRDWTRPISLELMGGPLQHDLTVDCAVKMHGGHSRLPEKTPKHALRIMFKGKYGASKLYYPVFGDQGVEKYESLVLRTFFGNSWTHQDEANRQRAQYTRDLWARATQQRMGHPHSKGQAVHLFLNGMYWGIYNLCERLDGEHCAYNYGGKKADYDVIKVDEEQGEKVVASDGDLSAWTEMRQVTEKVNASGNTEYFRLEGLDANGKRDTTLHPLLDIDNFMDYMLINLYAGNTDWDSHNWLAYRRRTQTEHGFRFFCWDTEMIFVNVNENITGKNTSSKPTHFLQCLLRNPVAKSRFNHRAHLALTKGGWLTEEGVTSVWDSLYSHLRNAIYDECARWGDYRRDIHPYTSQGHRYRISSYFMKERNRLLTEYFPKRTDTLIEQLKTRGWYTEEDDYEEAILPLMANRLPELIFDLQGRSYGRLSDNGSLPADLPSGIYIVGGRKVVKP